MNRLHLLRPIVLKPKHLSLHHPTHIRLSNPKQQISHWSTQPNVPKQQGHSQTLNTHIRHATTFSPVALLVAIPLGLAMIGTPCP
ncbi:hypothetical protein BDZ45DRAFT_672911 [Acephala macrosclerotiorum]|nr:hypothetical protein BDZ45DRAFT_672911 [Acephala macrosclerotiorum]